MLSLVSQRKIRMYGLGEAYTVNGEGTDPHQRVADLPEGAASGDDIINEHDMLADEVFFLEGV